MAIFIEVCQRLRLVENKAKRKSASEASRMGTGTGSKWGIGWIENRRVEHPCSALQFSFFIFPTENMFTACRFGLNF